MDIQMPKLNGIDTFIELRNRNIQIPVIAISAFCSEEDIEHFAKIGFNSFLSKPIINEDFNNILNKFMPYSVLL